MNLSAAIHTTDGDYPQARLCRDQYVHVALNAELTGAPADLYINQPDYLDALIRELQAAQAAWAITRGEAVSA